MRTIAVYGSPKLQVYRGERWLYARPVEKDVLTIGRDPECDLVLEGDDVSQLHVRLERDPDGDDYIVDAGDATSLNGARIKHALVHYGDVLGIGDYQIRLVPAYAA